MRIGYYIASSDEFRGNCIRLAGKAQMMWQKLGVGARPGEGARIIEFDDGTIVKQLLRRNESDEILFVDVD